MDFSSVFVVRYHPKSSPYPPYKYSLLSIYNKVEHSKGDKEIGYIDNESDSSASDSENDPWEDMTEEPNDDDDDVMQCKL